MNGVDPVIICFDGQVRNCCKDVLFVCDSDIQISHSVRPLFQDREGVSVNINDNTKQIPLWLPRFWVGVSCHCWGSHILFSSDIVAIGTG